MAGMYPVDQYKAYGCHTGKASSTFLIRRSEVEIGDHPRRDLPADPALVESLMGGFDTSRPLTVRDCGTVKGKRRLEVVNGCRRLVAAEVAEMRLNDAGKLKRTDGHYMVAIHVVDGDERALLRERILRNTDPLALPDSPAVLYKMLDELRRLGEDVAELQKLAPGVDVPALLRWPSLHSSVQIRLDAGEAPLAVLSAILDVPRDEQAEFLTSIVASKSLTPAKAKRKAREATGQPSSAPPFRLPTPQTFMVMRARVDETQNVKAAHLLDYLAGHGEALEASAPRIFAALEEARTMASKPGRKAKSDSAEARE